MGEPEHDVRQILYDNGAATSTPLMRIEFSDANGSDCSIQESSSSGCYSEAGVVVHPGPFLWLGCDSGRHKDGACRARMHLTQAQAQVLIEHLQAFVEKGSL